MTDFKNVTSTRFGIEHLADPLQVVPDEYASVPPDLAVAVINTVCARMLVGGNGERWKLPAVDVGRDRLPVPPGRGITAIRCAIPGVLAPEQPVKLVRSPSPKEIAGDRIICLYPARLGNYCLAAIKRRMSEDLLSREDKLILSGPTPVHENDVREAVVSALGDELPVPAFADELARSIAAVADAVFEQVTGSPKIPRIRCAIEVVDFQAFRERVG
jgi:hypothetical protein